MYLRTQTEEAIVDLDKSTSIVAEQGIVYINMISETSFVAGTYKTQERAKEVISEIFALLDVTVRYDMPVV